MKAFLNNQRVLLHLVLVTNIISAIYILNYYTPLYADDYSYFYSFATGNRITASKDIIYSQLAHYSNVNGRSIPHTIAQLYLLLGDSLFSVINSVAIVVLVYLLCFHSFGVWKPFSILSFLFFFFLLFLCTPAFGQSYLWITGSSNCLYGPPITLLFLLPHRINTNRPYLSTQKWLIEVFKACYSFLMEISLVGQMRAPQLHGL